MITTDLGHGRGWARSDAAASLFRMDAAHGSPLIINSAGRTDAQQQVLLDRWHAGGKYNRPPYLYQPAAVGVSPHNKGIAIDDTNDHAWMIANGERFGWFHDVVGDYPHFVYHPEKDQYATGSASSPTASQTVKDRQAFLNAHRGEHLDVDGKNGPKTKAATERYQTFLRAFGYTGKIDGVWGAGTQAAHAQYYNTLIPTTTTTSTGAHANPFGLADVEGLQKVAKKYGYTGAIDNWWGDGSAAGFAKFLAVNWRGSLAAWLRAKYGYVGNDVYGPVMRAALARANAANKAAL